MSNTELLLYILREIDRTYDELVSSNPGDDIFEPGATQYRAGLTQMAFKAYEILLSAHDFTRNRRGTENE